MNKNTEREIIFLEQSLLLDDISTKHLKKSIKAWNYIRDIKLMTLPLFLECHKIATQSLNASEAGKLRSDPIYKNNKKYYPVMLEEKTKNLIKNINSSLPARLASFATKDHQTFLALQPFATANNHIGRILLNWQRIRLGHFIKIFLK